MLECGIVVDWICVFESVVVGFWKGPLERICDEVVGDELESCWAVA